MATSPDPVPAGEAEAAAGKEPGLRTRTKAILVLVALAALYGLYVVSLQFFAYTSDAFVANDVVMVAAEVEGRIVAVHVRDNQRVSAGEPLITLDPMPYQLQVELRSAQLQKAEADALAAERTVARVEADRTASVAHLDFARVTERRYGDLAKLNAAPLQRYDESVTARLEAEAKLRAMDAVLAETRATALSAKATVGVAEQALDLARYNLAQTRVLASVDGYVNNLWLRVGDYARVGEARVGIVADDRWQVVALYREEVIRHLRPDLRVWLWLDSYPYQLFRGRVEGVARAIAHRDQQNQPLPQIAPTTGWIRFQQRFPVRIRFEALPADVRLHVGSNARALVIYGW
jgi:multidrug efflux system membrane fusion protein